MTKLKSIAWCSYEMDTFIQLTEIVVQIHGNV